MSASVVALLTFAGVASPAGAQVTPKIVVYQNIDFTGHSRPFTTRIPDLRGTGFNDRISSAVVQIGQWELCSDVHFRGRCIVIGPGVHRDLRHRGFNDQTSSLRPVNGGGGGPPPPPPQRGDIVLYEHDSYKGAAREYDGPVPNLVFLGFNDVASSVVVRRRRWQLCADANYRGRCITLGPGSYPRLSGHGLNDVVTSLRPI